jgi:hypothetical protein
MLYQQLRKVQHLVKDSAEFVQQVSSWHTDAEEVFFVKIDVKEYYMSGYVTDLAHDASRIIPEGAKSSMSSTHW